MTRPLPIDITEVADHYYTKGCIVGFAWGALIGAGIAVWVML